MKEQIIVLLGLNAEHEIIRDKNGIAFATGKLVHEGWAALYVASSITDAHAAIEYYKQNGTLVKFTEGIDLVKNNPEVK